MRTAMHPIRVVPTAGRRGFTIVELLVVVGIIAVLATLITPAVIRARGAARNAAIKTEIDMLHMAIMNYKNEYGSFPPCRDAVLSGTSPAAKHLLRLFPRTANAALELEPLYAGQVLHPGNAIRLWLPGYSTSPTSPIKGGARRKLYDFDQTRCIDDATSALRDGYVAAGALSSPFVYIDRPNYGQIVNGVSNEPYVFAGNTYRAEVSNGVAFFNPDTFQILCAGKDGIWGNEDDLSNFWNGTREQHAARSQ